MTLPMKRLAMIAQATWACSVNSVGPGREPLLEEGTHQDGDGRRGRNAEGEQRDQRGVGMGVVGRLRPGNTLDGALGPVRSRCLRELLLGAVGQAGRTTEPVMPGIRPSTKPMPVPRGHGWGAAGADPYRWAAATESPGLYRLGDHPSAAPAGAPDRPNRADDDRHEADAVEEPVDSPNVKRGAPATGSMPDHGDQQAQEHRRSAPRTMDRAGQRDEQ